MYPAQSAATGASGLEGRAPMIQVRELEKSEYGKLAHVAEGYIPPADYSIVMVAEDEGEIVGRIFLISPVHIEGPWIRNDKRCGLILTRLIEAAERQGRKVGVKTIFAYAVSEEIEGGLVRLGFAKRELTVWSKEI